MMDTVFQNFVNLAGGDAELAVLIAVFAGVLIAVVGIRSLLAPADPIVRRLDQQPDKGTRPSSAALRKGQDALPQKGVFRFIMPADSGESHRIEQQLMRAGFRGEQALVSYYCIRAVLGFLLPLPLMLGTLTISATAETGVRLPLLDLDTTGSMTLACLMLLAGFYGPPIWLKRRIKARQRAIRHGFPHALDMMQVAIEAGLGFDSALARVANELKHAHPALAEEFAIVGLELRAGKAREQVLADLAERTQVDAISIFTKAIIQSVALGTSVTATLQVYARDMRQHRMLMAEERANQLPVKMSVIMVVFLLPTIFLLALSPVIIRLARLFTGDALPFN
jgi:tight adherence protein C